MIDVRPMSERIVSSSSDAPRLIVAEEKALAHVRALEAQVTRLESALDEKERQLRQALDLLHEATSE